MKAKTFSIMFFVVLLFISSFLASLPQTKAQEVETRYFRSDYHEIHGLTAQALDITQTSTADVQSMSALVGGTYQVGIRVWVRNSSEIEVEVTSGTPIAIVSRTLKSGSAQGYQSATWDCPETDMDTTDSIVVRSYIRKSTQPWNSNPPKPFTTGYLEADQLDSATWNVTYYTKLTIGSTWYWEYGYQYANSRIENFSWSVTEEHNVTFYFHIGGSLLVNGTITSNGTSTDYSEGTILNITGVPDSDFEFLRHIYDSSESTDNPFFLTVTQDYSTHTYFSPTVWFNSAYYLATTTSLLLLMLLFIPWWKRRTQEDKT